MEAEYAQYMETVEILDSCGVSRAALAAQKADCYKKLADLNREIRQTRKQIKMCDEIQRETSTIERQLQKLEPERNTRKHDRVR